MNNLATMVFMVGSALKNAAMKAVDIVLPPRCVLSGDLVERQGMIAPAAWASLDFIAPPFCDCCGRPFEFEVGQGALCVECLEDRPSFNTARAPLKYNDASRDLILGFKHGDKTHAVLAFVPWLQRTGADMLAYADYLVPVPLHRWRFMRRRYNQAAIMAYALSKVTNIKCIPDLLMRMRPTATQGHLNPGERQKNVRKAFALNPRCDVKGKNIVLIDDVYTTGATVKECAETLLKKGAARVDVLTLARVYKNI